MTRDSIPIVGLCGAIGSGKDTLASRLSYAGFKRYKFADPLYAMANALDPSFHPDMAHADKRDWLLGVEAFGTRRNFLQQLGTEFLRRRISEDFFILYMEQAIHNHMEHHPTMGVVISDVRFENEAACIRGMGGHIVHLKPTWACQVTDHESDRAVAFAKGDSILGLKEGQPDLGHRMLLGLIEDAFGRNDGPIFNLKREC